MIDNSKTTPIVYRNSIGWKIFTTLLTPPLIGLSIWAIINSITEIGKKDTLFVILFLLMGSGMFVFGVYALIAIYKSRLEIHPDQICDVGVFRKRKLLFDEILGYREIPTQYVKTIEFVSKNSKNIKASLIYNNNDELFKWINTKFINLDSKEYNQAIETVESDTQLGITKNQRLETLSNAKKIAKAFNIICYATALWGLFYPNPYKIIMWILILLPIISVILIYFKKGVIKIDEIKNSPYPTTANGFIVSGGSLALRAIMDFNILAWNTILVPVISITVVFYLAIFLVATDIRKKVITVVSIMLFCGVYGFGTAIILNGIMDSSSPKNFEAEIRDKHISSGKSMSYYLKLSPWGPQKNVEDVRVSKNRYDQYKINDKVLIQLSKGALNIPWYTIIHDDSRVEM